MKKTFIKILLVFTLLFSFNISFVHVDADEVEESQIEKTQESIEKQDEEVSLSDPDKKEITEQKEGSNDEDDLEEGLNDQNNPNASEQEPANLGEGNNPQTPSESETETEVPSSQFVNQTAKVVISKVDKNSNPLAGASLQVLDSAGNVVASWVSGNEAKELELPNGKYTLHEVQAPKGYVLAEDKSFEVKIEVTDLQADADYSKDPCPHYYGTPMYYVQIEGSEEEYEVYCINQGWDTPDGGSTYNGQIITPDNVRDFTKQTTIVGIDENNYSNYIASDGPIDVSDQSLSNQELYDKLLNIIYHRYLASSVLGEQGFTYSTEEIRFITEVALKNYTNPGLGEGQYNIVATDELIEAFDKAGVVYQLYMDGDTRKVSYVKHNYRDFVYTPDVPLGKDIVAQDYGNGYSFGQMVAGHFNRFTRKDHLHPDVEPSESEHNAKNNQEERDQVARYYELYKYLISDEDPHPADMNLFIYTANMASPGFGLDEKYQNLLGITGYIDTDEEQKTVYVEMVNESEKREISVEKIWEDKDNYSKARPKTITINLKADGETIETVTLSERTKWSYKFENLDKYNNGKEIVYTITEDEIPEYSTEIEGDMNVGFTVINTVYGRGGDNPQTADNVFVYVIVLLISLFGLVSLSKVYIKNN